MKEKDDKRGLMDLPAPPKKTHVEHVEHCDECPFVTRDDCGDLALCNADDDVIPSAKYIPGNCPLIETDVLVTIRKPPL